jgi:hypothetical protein
MPHPRDVLESRVKNIREDRPSTKEDYINGSHVSAETSGSCLAIYTVRFVP